MSSEKVRSLIAQGDYDGTHLRETIPDDLDTEKIATYFRQTTGKGIDDFGIDRLRLFENKRILVGRCITVAGLLMFGRYPQVYLPQSAIKVVRFNGNDVGSDFIDRGELTGTLPEMIEAAMMFVQRHTNRGAKIEGSRRLDVPEYLPEVVREAIINAVVHREYSITNAHIAVFIFDDRLEVRSPGRLPNAASLDILPLGDHHPRNRLLFLFLEALGYGERVGTGIPRMIRLCRERGYTEPRFEEVGEGFWVTMYGKRL